MSALLERPPEKQRAATQPLSWDWVADWVELEHRVEAVETGVSWNWRRDLADLHRQLDELAARVRR